MKEDLSAILSNLNTLKVGVVGDFALDVYYNLEKETGEYSLETGKPVHHGNEVRTQLGGAGNVVHNLYALGVGKIVAFGMYGDDMWGRELLYRLHKLEVDTSNMVMRNDNWESCTYIKPMIGRDEESRIDFGTHNRLIKEAQETIFKNIESVIDSLDILIINRQCVTPLIDEDALDQINRLAKKHASCKFFADLREGGECLKNITLKVNVKEVASITGHASADEKDLVTCMKLAETLSEKIEGPVLLTRGENGIIYVNKNQKYQVNGIYVPGETDTVGAGDTVISAFAACMGAGANPRIALEVANLAAAITVRKLGQTGTAHPDEISRLQKNSAYIYNSDKAADLRKAVYWQNTDIEIVIPTKNRDSATQHVIFDHDGTVSTLREGWEQVMYPVMMESICGDSLFGLNQERYDQLSEKVHKFIDQTTGIQTIVQMQGLVEMINEEGFVSPNQIKSAGEYKAIYLNALMETVNDRLQRFKRGERLLHDFTMSGAVRMLEKLNNKGVRLYLASGTDEENVKEEATALGYADLFNGGIYGSKGNEIGDAKRMVINRILEENHCKGENLMVIGDGPVEIREGRRVGAICVGIASDEVRRYGLHAAKRTRLILAGAHLIIPDFAQGEALLSFVEEPLNV